MAEADYRYLLDYVYIRGNGSGFVTNPERFSTGLVLQFTHKWTNPKFKLPDLIMSPEIFNPEFKVGTLNLETFESGEFSSCSVIATKLLSLRQTDQNGGSSDVVSVLVTSMVINGSRWLLHSVTGPGNHFSG